MSLKFYFRPKFLNFIFDHFKKVSLNFYRLIFFVFKIHLDFIKLFIFKHSILRRSKINENKNNHHFIVYFLGERRVHQAEKSEPEEPGKWHFSQVEMAEKPLFENDQCQRSRRGRGGHVGRVYPNCGMVSEGRQPVQIEVTTIKAQILPKAKNVSN